MQHAPIGPLSSVAYSFRDFFHVRAKMNEEVAGRNGLLGTKRHAVALTPSLDPIHSSLRVSAALTLSHPLFVIEHLGFDCRLLVNRKQQLKMDRVWTQGNSGVPRKTVRCRM
ncbi:hypothetical protein EI94DRAFT_1716663 [Lactarius quietus]|nr:hypothetical protein EI94DRAFT_1716663 [Lactarius quietus]